MTQVHDQDGSEKWGDRDEKTGAHLWVRGLGTEEGQTDDRKPECWSDLVY